MEGRGRERERERDGLCSVACQSKEPGIAWQTTERGGEQNVLGSVGQEELRGSGTHREGGQGECFRFSSRLPVKAHSTRHLDERRGKREAGRFVAVTRSIDLRQLLM